MNRLATRLAGAMLLVAGLSAAAIILSQEVGAALHFRTLPEEVQGRILQDRERREAREDDFAGAILDVRDYQARATLVGAALAALVAVTIAVFLARTISRPIERVSAASARLAEGDLSARAPPSRRGSSVEAKALTRDFNTMATSLETYERERRAMIADIAHELRTPLAAMKLRLQALEDDLVPFDKTEVRRLHRQTDLLSRLVQDLRTLSLADAGKLSLQKRETDLVALVKEVLETYEERAAAREVALALETSSPQVRACVDPDRIEQVVSNLLDNALRVTPEGGSVTVGVRGEPGHVILSVSDTGPGLSEGAIAHLFDRFFQDKDTKGSSGLGLAIVHALVTLHGGRVEAFNHDEGATFEVRLPRGEGKTAAS